MGRLNIKFVGMFVFGSLACLFTPAEAVILYVDKDNKSCPGSGSSSTPYCTIQAAFNVARPGDVIRIRNAATPYDEKAVTTRSGTASAPITVEPDVGHLPRLRYSARNAQAGVIEIKDADYWQIRGLTFDGNGTQTSMHAVVLQAFSRSITGNRIVQNAFLNWGGTGENTKGASALILKSNTSNTNAQVKNSFVIANTFSRNAHQAIRLIKTSNIIIEDNLIQNTLCGRSPDTRAGATGIKDSQGSVGNIIRYNVITDHQGSEDCLLPNQGNAKYVGIYCDTGSTRGHILGNVVYDIDNDHPENTNPRATDVSSVGIQLESRCSDWRVEGNLVYNIGIHGLRNGSPSTGDPNKNVWTNNTVYGVGRNAMWIARGKTLTIKNNILVLEKPNAVIELTKTAVDQGPHSIDHNLYWDAKDGTKVGRWGDHLIRNLTNWRTSCKCDNASLSVNPSFVSVSAGSEDFRLRSTSAARDAGEGDVDLGAYSIVHTLQ
jgi:hypothetical protein